MFDVGMGELLILAVVGLLVFGPERLPRAAADAARMLRNVKAMASTARKDLADASGLDMAETKQTLQELQSYHPKKLVADLFDDDDEAPAKNGSAAKGSQGTGANPSASAPRFDPDAT
jgi:sec-independent protein translocase protein TatB